MAATGTQRIPSVPADQWTDDVREVYAVYEGEEGRRNGSKYNFTRWFANHPPLALNWMRYNHALTRGVLDPRLREIVVLRIADRYKSDYEWVQHVKIAAPLGIGPAELEAIRHGPAHPTWSELERNALRAADALCEQHDIDDALWNDLARDLDHKQLMELLFLIGSYTLLAWVMRAVRMPLEPEDQALARA